MNLFSPNYLKELCAEYGLTPSKEYGQNYLIAEKPIREIIEAGELNSNDVVVEIGPGFGVLTLAMAPQVKKLIAFEIEKKLQDYWEEKQKEFKNIEIIWGNFVYQFPEMQEKFPKNYKVLANVPYQITSQIIRMLLEAKNPPERIIIMVQKEVAQRICAKPGEMSVLAISVQYYGTPKIVTKVTKGNFFPSPKVDSAVISIRPKKQESEKANFSDERFFEVVRAGFAHPRKQVWRNLTEGLQMDGEKIKHILVELVGNEKVRAEELSVEDWKILVGRLSI